MYYPVAISISISQSSISPQILSDYKILVFNIKHITYYYYQTAAVNPMNIQPQYQFQCSQIRYIDCRSWFDFAEEIVTLIIAFGLFLRVAKHYRNLKKQKQEHAVTEHQKSVRRKIRVNLIQIIYLGFIIFNTLFDMFLFFMYQKAAQHPNIDTVAKWYKVSEVLYINWLNTLNLTVGFLYWKATRAYYVLSQLQVPKLFRRFSKRIFFVFFCFNASAVIIAIVFIVIDWQQIDPFPFKIVTLFTTTSSIVLCVGCRILYRQHILTKVDLSQKAITNEKIISVLLLISSLLRMFIYTLDIVYEEWAQRVRNQQMNEEGGCLDTWPYYSLILLCINMVINLLPAGIYSHLFVSEVVAAKLGSSRDNRLLKKTSDQY